MWGSEMSVVQPEQCSGKHLSKCYHTSPANTQFQQQFFNILNIFKIPQQVCFFFLIHLKLKTNQSYIALFKKPDKRKLSQSPSRMRTSSCDRKETSDRVEMTKSTALPWLKAQK